MSNLLKMIAAAAVLLAVGVATTAPAFANPDANDNPYYPDNFRDLPAKGH